MEKESRGIDMRHPELLVPASSLEVLKIAVVFGADAVYIGGEGFGLRAKAKNFSMDDMQKGIDFKETLEKSRGLRFLSRSQKQFITFLYITFLMR